MNFRVIALASCVALGSIALGDKAQAQSVNVPFTGTLTNACTFGTVTQGTVVRSGILNAVEGSAGLTGFTVGTAGRVTLNCTAGGRVSATAPVLVGTAPVGFTPTTRQAVVQVNNSIVFTSATVGTAFPGAWTGKATTAAPVIAGAQTLNVALIVGTPGPATVSPPAGTYNYNVQLTATSN